MTAVVNAKEDNLPLAVGTIIITVFALALGDALVKRFSAEFVLWQIFVLRALLALPVLILIFKTKYPRLSLQPDELLWTAARSVMLALMWVVYYTALPFTDLSVAAAAYYTLPLFITLFAALFIGDKVGPKGWVAVALGFFGVLLILQPDTEQFNRYALLPIISAILYALAMVITRTKCRNENVLVLSISLNISMLIIGILVSLVIWIWSPHSDSISHNPFLLGPWASMGTPQWLTMALLATAIIIGSVGAAIAYQSGPSSIVGTFDFAYVAFAAIWGFILFAEVPSTVTIVGMLLIVCAGILALRK